MHLLTLEAKEGHRPATGQGSSLGTVGKARKAPRPERSGAMPSCPRLALGPGKSIPSFRLPRLPDRRVLLLEPAGPGWLAAGTLRSRCRLDFRACFQRKGVALARKQGACEQKATAKRGLFSSVLPKACY